MMKLSVIEIQGPALGVVFAAVLCGACVSNEPELLALACLGTYALLSHKAGKSQKGKISSIPSALEQLVPATDRPKVLALLLVVVLVSCALNGYILSAIASTSALMFLALHNLGTQKCKVPPKCSAGDVPFKQSGLSSWSAPPHASPAPAQPVQRYIPSQRTASQALKSIRSLQSQQQQPPSGLVEMVVRKSIPTIADEALATRIAHMCEQCIKQVVPEAEVKGVAVGNLKELGREGSKPEVDVVMTVDFAILEKRLRDICAVDDRCKKDTSFLPGSLRKTATKMMYERMTIFARYWRSQLSGPDCMMVMLLPENSGFGNQQILINFQVNVQHSLRRSSLLSKNKKHVSELIAFVCYWARERCVTNSARGLLHKYGWAALVQHFVKYNVDATTDKDTLNMFEKFVVHFASKFEESDQELSFAFSNVKMPNSEEKRMFNLPYIEDPMEPGSDLAHFVNADGMERIVSEFSRAREILAQRSKDVEHTASRLLERWQPTLADAGK